MKALDLLTCFFFSGRLWHQLTLKLITFVKEEHFSKNGGLVEVRPNNTRGIINCMGRHVDFIDTSLHRSCHPGYVHVTSDHQIQ